MNICVYGASSMTIDQIYIKEGERLGNSIGKNDDTLVFGGGANGMMGAVARGTSDSGGKIIGIAPEFFNVDGVLFDKCSEFIFPENMRDRKRKMEELSDAFIITPGGIGTFDEFFEIFTLKQLCRHNKPIALFNINNYFDDMINFLKITISKNFMSDKSLSLFFVSDCIDDIMNYIKTYKPDKSDISDFKAIK